MRKVKKSAIFSATRAILICTILLVACNKENAGVTPVNNLPSSSKTETIQPNNPNNPLESIGINHNIHLNDVLSIISCNYIYPNGLSPEDALDVYYDYLNNMGYTKESMDFAFEIIENGYSLPNNVNHYIESLLDSISIIPNVSYNNYKHLVFRYEDRIMADATLNDIEEGALLAYTSVLRHSMYFWYEVPSKAIPNWLQIVGADAAGAATGFASCADDNLGMAIVCGILVGAGKSIEKAGELKEIEKPTTDSAATGTN